MDLRNFKDFLGLYNQLSEVCFGACVENLNSRALSKTEESCVERCCTKYTNMNHRIIRTYTEVQPVIQQKKIEEMEKQMQEAQVQAVKQQEAEQKLLQAQAESLLLAQTADYTSAIF